MDIFVFRTGIENNEHINDIAPHLNSLRGIHKWNFDLEDHENILRIEAVGITADFVKDILTKANYFCEELPD